VPLDFDAIVANHIKMAASERWRSPFLFDRVKKLARRIGRDRGYAPPPPAHSLRFLGGREMVRRLPAAKKGQTSTSPTTSPGHSLAAKHDRHASGNSTGCGLPKKDVAVLRVRRGQPCRWPFGIRGIGGTR
jgi:hypothetical protein